MGCGCNQNKQVLPNVPIIGDSNTSINNLDAVRLLRTTLPGLTDTPESNLKVIKHSESKQTDINKPEHLKRRRRRVVRRHQRGMRRHMGRY